MDEEVTLPRGCIVTSCLVNATIIEAPAKWTRVNANTGYVASIKTVWTVTAVTTPLGKKGLSEFTWHFVLVWAWKDSSSYLWLVTLYVPAELHSLITWMF